MCLERASHGVRSYRSLPADWDPVGLGSARNSHSPIELHPPASPSVPVYLQAVKLLLARLIRFLRYGAWFCLPNVAVVFGNGAVTRKLSRARDVQDCLARPFMRICV